MYKVMIVDDDALIRKGLKMVIDWEKNGYTVVTEAANGLEALENLKIYSVDLVVADINMPEMDGLQLIESIRKTNSKIKFIIISAYNDFEYARQAISLGVTCYLLKPIEEELLKEALAQIMQEVKEDEKNLKLRLGNYLRNALDGRFSDVSGAIPYPYCDAETLCYIELIYDNFNGVFDTSKSKKKSVTLQIFDIMKKIFTDKFDYLIINNDEYVAAVPVFCKEFQFNSLEDLINAIRKALNNANIHPVSILVGGSKTNIENINDSKAEVETLRLKKFYCGNGIELYYQKESTIKFNNNISDNSFFDRIFTAAEIANPEALKRCADEFCNMLCEESIHPSIARLYCNTITVSVSKFVLLPDNVVRLLSINSEFNKLTDVNIEMMRTFLIEFFNIFITYISDERERRSFAVISEILDFINSNYNKNITFADIEEKFYMNKAYLGRLFKKKLGKSFNLYLNEVRLEKAKELLRNTDLKIYEVAEQVGYSTQNYFTIKFDELEGMTPQDYRKKYLP